MLSDYQVQELFSNKEFIGTILRLSSLLEISLDSVLAQYFIRNDRIRKGLNLIISEMPFGKIIEILAKLPLNIKFASHKRAILGFRSFPRIRKIAAQRSLQLTRGTHYVFKHFFWLGAFPDRLRNPRPSLRQERKHQAPQFIELHRVFYDTNYLFTVCLL